MFTAGVIQIGAAAFAVAVSESAIHEILAATLCGFGILSLGLGAVIERLPKR